MRREATLPFNEGDRLDRKTFHELYEDTPEDFHAELVGGVVYFIQPGTFPQGRYRAELLGWLEMYHIVTPGTDALGAVAVILDEASEPQPNACLLTTPECGGKTFENADGYLEGPPELVIEVWSGREKYAFEAKRRDYERAGVREFLHVSVPESRVTWFTLRGDRYEEIEAGADGICRSEVFPGLCLDATALIRDDAVRLAEVVRHGTTTPEHAAFVGRLAAARTRP
jgi:Uma2 family endonuclease